MNHVKRIALLAAPPLILGTTLIVFRLLVAHLGLKAGHLCGFLFYWVVWCALLPLWVLGTDGINRVFKPGSSRFGQPPAIGVVLLVLPCLLGYGYAFPRALHHANASIILLSAILALTNGTLEELLWRGSYLKTFPADWLRGWAYPSLGFAVWHFAPLAVLPNRAPGGNLLFVLVAGAAGMMWGWVAYRSRSILWATVAHVLFDFSGLGARIYFS